ncbi:MAG: NUDIX hydrolase [Pseudomonadota bacterium]
MTETKPAVPPRLSATILLIRGQGPLEVLMVKRHHEIDFASGALVFPGGKACEDDRSPDWGDLYNGQETGDRRVAKIAAIRELFEEAGILLARERASGAPVSKAVVDALQPVRSAVESGETHFSDVVKRAELALDPGALVHFGHWITPEFMPKRFDTHFYLAAAPDGQVAEQDGRETTEALWLSPAAALDMEKAGEATIIFPTRMNLGRLALCRSTGEALEKFAGEPVTTVLPKIEKDETGSPFLSIPDIEGYGQTREPLGKIANVIKR